MNLQEILQPAIDDLVSSAAPIVFSIVVLMFILGLVTLLMKKLIPVLSELLALSALYIVDKISGLVKTN